MIGGIVIALVLGLLDLARLGFAVHQLDQAASETARFAAVRSTESDQPASVAAIEDHARSRAGQLAGPPPAVTTRFLPNGAFVPGNQVEIELTYSFAFTMGIMPLPALELRRRTIMPILH